MFGSLLVMVCLFEVFVCVDVEWFVVVVGWGFCLGWVCVVVGFGIIVVGFFVGIFFFGDCCGVVFVDVLMVVEFE